MFHPITYDELHRTYLARFSGTLTEQDMIAFDAATVACRTLHGPADGLVDFTEVDLTEITTKQFVSRGMRPQIMTGHRRAVVANGLLFGMMRMFAAYQSRDDPEPMIIKHSLPEAYEALGLVACDFHPVALGPPPIPVAPVLFDPGTPVPM